MGRLRIRELLKQGRYRVLLAVSILSVLIIAAALIIQGAFNHPPKKQAHTFPTYINKTIPGLEVESIIDNDIYMAVHYPKTGIAQIDASIRESINEMIEAFNVKRSTHAEHKDELYVTFEAFRYSEDIISFKFEIYEYYYRQAHGVTTVRTMTFDTAAQAQYFIVDIFEGNKAYRALSDYIYHAFASDPALQPELETIKTALKPVWETFSRFVLQDDALEIFFDQYQIAAGAQGVLSCRVSLADVAQYLTEDFKRFKSIPEDEKQVLDGEQVLIEKEDVGIYRDKKLIAITFDDGPHAVNTPELLDFLAQAQVKATFFVLGSRLEYYPDIAKRIVAEGHQIGSHTYNHKWLTRLSAEELIFELYETNRLIYSITNVRINALRPPYGDYNDDVIALSHMPIVNWSIDPEDWKYKDADRIFHAVVEDVRDGDIILLHDMYETSVEAAKMIIHHLKEEGYTFVTVDTLIRARQGETAAGEVYKHIGNLSS